MTSDVTGFFIQMSKRLAWREVKIKFLCHAAGLYECLVFLADNPLGTPSSGEFVCRVFKENIILQCATAAVALCSAFCYVEFD